MGVMYRFTVQGVCCKCGQPGEIRGGIIEGPLTLTEAIHIAVEDCRTPEREPLLIVDNGKVIFDAAAIRERLEGIH